jgi:tetraacyldisaccharide 4'-kinase
MRAPEFWQRGGWPATALAPLSWLHDLGARLRDWRTVPADPGVPVICVGNLTAGGTGKTPVAIEIARHLATRGRRPAFLTRGHGGRLAGPVRVDPDRHDADAVGDEPLLLARVAPTFVARDRPAGARAAVAAGADVLVMDDGLQNPSLAKTLRIVVVDGATGFGNGRVIPAGPLRIPLARGLAQADLFVLMGADAAGTRAMLAASGPVVDAALETDPEDAAAFAGRRVVAFAGIGRPEKFFASLERCGAEIVHRAGFPDHHRFAAAELGDLTARARAAGAALATTAKDAVRLPSALRAAVVVLPVRAVFAPAAALFGPVEEAADVRSR